MPSPNRPNLVGPVPGHPEPKSWRKGPSSGCRRPGGLPFGVLTTSGRASGASAPWTNRRCTSFGNDSAASRSASPVPAGLRLQHVLNAIAQKIPDGVPVGGRHHNDDAIDVQFRPTTPPGIGPALCRTPGAGAWECGTSFFPRFPPANITPAQLFTAAPPFSILRKKSDPVPTFHSWHSTLGSTQALPGMSCPSRTDPLYQPYWTRLACGGCR